MSAHRLGLTRAEHQHRFIGTWHITAMQAWDASYFNRERQTVAQVRPDHTGSFQFGLVSGAMDGMVEGALGK